MLTRSASAWVALLGAVLASLLYLNSAVYSAWLGGGPPTTIREAWMQRAFAHLCYAAGAMFIGIGAFRFIRRLPRFDRVGLVLVLLAGVAVAAPKFRRFILVGGCNDAGGHWAETSFRCER